MTSTHAPLTHERPRPDGSDVRPVGAGEIADVSRALADAFYDDALMTWVFRATDRRARLEAAFELYTRRFWIGHGMCLTTDRLAGGAMWMPPGAWQTTLLEDLRALPAVIGMARRDTVRLLRLLSTMEKAHPHDHHYYLPVIGVRTEWQGRGFGAALLRPVLERCDREGAPAYLEATSPRNRAMYERHGFAVTGELRVGDSPVFWPMRREAR